MRKAENDWTLDTNVLINANGSKQQRVLQDAAAKADHAAADRPVGGGSRKENARNILRCIQSQGYLCWSTNVAQEYISRGAVELSKGLPPVPVSGQFQTTWVTSWLAQPQAIACLVYPKVRKLSGAEKDDLKKAMVRDEGDYPFLELARSSQSKRLVTEEEDYGPAFVKSIKRLLDVACLDYEAALEICRR